jgi:hypothetical protein
MDLFAATVARLVCFPKGPKQVALAVPRARQPLAAFLGLYFTVARIHGTLPIKGCVSVSTRDAGLKELIASLQLHVAGAPRDTLRSGRLVTGQPDPTGHASAKIGELQGTKRIKGVSQDEKYLLLQAPHYRPKLVLNVVSVSIVDAASMSSSGWDLTYDWNASAERAQVWIGELGDCDFEDFCAARGIPIWHFDWGAIGEVAERFGAGASRLSTAAVCERAHELPSFQIRPCPDPAVDDELARLETAFASIYRRTKGRDMPRAVAQARRLHYLLARLVAPLAVYEPIAVASRALEPRVALQQLRDAPRAWFEGAQWKGVYDAEWPAVRASLTALYDHVKSEHPKYYDALALIEEARAAGTHLVFRCPTRAEANALITALVADGFVAPEELGPSKLVDVRWLGAGSPALNAGRGDAPITSVISEPLPRYSAAGYLTAEEGHYQALLYPSQISRIERLARDCAASSCGAGRNGSVLSYFVDSYPGMDGVSAPGPTFERLDPFPLTGRRALKESSETKQIITMAGFFERLQYDDEEMSYSSGSRGHEERPARLLATVEGFYVYLAEDDEVPVLVQGEKMIPRPVASLRPGQRIVLMPGADRSTMLADLFHAYDEKLGPAYPLLYARAFEAAWEQAGGTDAALAAKVGVEPSTVATWRRGEHRPQQDEHLNAVLKLSGIGPAWSSRSAIRTYLATVRGAHRTIAKIFDEAVVETVVELGGERQEQLATYGLDLDELLGSIQVLTVASVSEDSRSAPGNLIGHFLTADHIAVKGAA